MSVVRFKQWLDRWQLTPEGEGITTPYSELLPVSSTFGPAILKISRLPEESRGAETLEWFRGEGAVRVYAREEHVVLMERATGNRRLVGMNDDDATRVICDIARKLHSRHDEPPSSAVPLREWFRALSDQRARSVADELLASQQDVAVLHGDLHHENVLDGGEARGWLAIDPKGLYGERTFDFANILLNPNKETALKAGRLRRQLEVIAESADLNFDRLKQWVYVFAMLSAAWSREDGYDPAFPEAVATRVLIA